jgi:HlyD family secretion protein
MKRRLFVATVAGLMLALCACGGAGEETPTPMPGPPLDSLVSVTGEVVPAKWATLSIQSDGMVENVLVEAGDDVKAGDLLVKLDAVDAELAVFEAEAQLANARAQVEQLEGQPRITDVAAVERQVDEAEAGISQAVAERDRLASGVIQSDIAEAQADLEAAEAEREAIRIDYDELQDELEDDLIEDWEGEKAAMELVAARQSVEAAQIGLAYARGSASARMEEAEAGVRAAEAQLAVVEAQLKQTGAGAAGEEIALAETEVEQAQLALSEAQLQLERCERRAPFDGTVGMVHIRRGEQVRQGDAVVTLGDLSTLRVETTDLDEIDVAKVEAGQSVDVTFDAFPDRVFRGRVVRIDPVAEAGGGGVNYTTIIELEELAPEIRWGMTAFVDIEVGN